MGGALVVDYAVLGAGCAGLSLAVQLLRQGLGSRRLIIVDRRTEFARDRTWCFWNAEPHPFEDAVTHTWPRWEVGDGRRSVIRESRRYRYQHLPADAFYRSALGKLRERDDVELRLGSEVGSVEDHGDRAIVEAGDGPLAARLVFDSRPIAAPGAWTGEPGARTRDVELLQHFRGRFVRTALPVFEPGTATLMDFGTSQERGIHFFYVLPFAANRALVETTYFTPAPWSEEVYAADLNAYLDRLAGPGGWEAEGREGGAIPMSTRTFDARPSRRVCRIGLAGGLGRPATGYAFLAIQRFSAELARRLAGVDDPSSVELPHPRRSRTLFLDRVYLSYLSRFPDRAPETMLRLFEGVEADALVRFLSEAGSLTDDLRVMQAMPPSLALEAIRSRRLWLRPDRRPWAGEIGVRLPWRRAKRGRRSWMGTKSERPTRLRAKPDPKGVDRST